MRVLEQTTRGVRSAGGALGGLDAAPDDEARDEPGEIEREDDHVEQIVHVHEHVSAQALKVDLLALGGQDACEARRRRVNGQRSRHKCLHVSISI